MWRPHGGRSENVKFGRTKKWWTSRRVANNSDNSVNSVESIETEIERRVKRQRTARWRADRLAAMPRRKFIICEIIAINEFLSALAFLKSGARNSRTDSQWPAGLQTEWTWSVFGHVTVLTLAPNSNSIGLAEVGSNPGPDRLPRGKEFLNTLYTK